MDQKVRVIALVCLLLAFSLLGPQLMKLAIIPGPEGLNCSVHGVQFGDYSNELWVLGEFRSNQILESLEVSENVGVGGLNFASAYSNLEIRGVYPNPYNTEFRKDIHVEAAMGPISASQDIYTTLLIERERPTVHDVNVHGDPLGSSDPMEIKYIEYLTPQKKEGNTITFKKYVIHVVPVEFVVQMSVRGDRWAGWENTHLWLSLETTAWRTAFTESQVEAIQEWLDKDPPENATLSAYDFRGGFPIWGWVTEWDPLTWCDEDERETSPPQNAYDNVRIRPDLAGREIALYTEPSYLQDLSLKEKNVLQDEALLESVLIGDIAALPDPDFATTVYTPFYIEKFYPYYEEGPWWNHYLSQWYPTTWMRIRVLYAIYGEFVYLWSVEEAKEQGYNPSSEPGSTWEKRMSTYAYEEGPWAWLSDVGGWLASPSGILTLLIILGTIFIVVIILIGGPGLLLNLFRWKGKRR